MNKSVAATALLMFFIVAPSPGQQLPPSDPLPARVERLETAIQLIKEYNDDFLAVILWSLATLSGLAALLVGFNWFQSNRLLRGEIESLRAELRGIIDSRLAEIEAPLRTSLDQAMAEQRKATATAVKTTVTAALSPLQNDLVFLQRRVGDLEYDSLEAGVKLWLREDVPTNACRSATDLLAKATELQNHWRIGDALDLLDKSLSALQAKAGKLEAIWLSQTEHALERVGDEHKSARNALSSKLQKIQAS